MPDFDFDVIVIGAGATGLIAAKHVAQRGYSTASCEAFCFGGLITNVNELNPPLPGAYLSGVELASNLMTEIAELGVENMNETVTGLARNGASLTVSTDAGTYGARAVIVASGAKMKLTGVPGEAQFLHRGVAQCADCDGPLYHGEDVAVVGGGDSALQEALVLARYCKHVHLVHRGSRFRAHRDLIEAIAACDNVHIRWNTIVTELRGGEGLEMVCTRDVRNGATLELPCRGFFAYIGLQPNSELAPAEIDRDADGFLHTDAALQTAMKGVYAAGAVRAGFGGLLSDASADGERAAASVAARLSSPMDVAG